MRQVPYDVRPLQEVWADRVASLAAKSMIDLSDGSVKAKKEDVSTRSAPDGHEIIIYEFSGSLSAGAELHIIADTVDIFPNGVDMATLPTNIKPMKIYVRVKEKKGFKAFILNPTEAAITDIDYMLKFQEIVKPPPEQELPQFRVHIYKG